ncbi:MAG: GIY-YIG nuclease family protein [Clostridium sp.]
MTEENYTYILECADGTLYCGWTNHLQERVAAHNAGKSARYTKSRRPVVLEVLAKPSVQSRRPCGGEWSGQTAKPEGKAGADRGVYATNAYIMM